MSLKDLPDRSSRCAHRPSQAGTERRPITLFFSLYGGLFQSHGTLGGSIRLPNGKLQVKLGTMTMMVAALLILNSGAPPTRASWCTCTMDKTLASPGRRGSPDDGAGAAPPSARPLRLLRSSRPGTGAPSATTRPWTSSPQNAGWSIDWDLN